MRGTVLYGPRDIRFEERTAPTIMKPTGAIIRITATYVCGSHLWPQHACSSLRASCTFAWSRPFKWTKSADPKLGSAVLEPYGSSASSDWDKSASDVAYCQPSQLI